MARDTRIQYQTMISKRVIETAIEKAREKRDDAYSPYSEYSVGAVAVCIDETQSVTVYYEGCNIENPNYSNTVHAEELAVSNAVADGHREVEFVVVATEEGDVSDPCGSCQQYIKEFGSEDTPIIVQTEGMNYEQKPLKDCELFSLE